MLEIGSIVDGKYKILNKIGKGGMSTVYLAMNERANKPWAVKEVRKDGSTDFEVVKQSQIMETNLLKKLNHPNLPSIIDVIDQTDSFLIVMDYIEGKPLSEALKEKKSFMCEDVIEWAKQLCDVLEYLHTRKPPIIYRDMKPGNIMLQPDGTVKLIDFGIAREFKDKNVEDTTCLGTRGYAAPEQFGGQGQTDARTDIYCLGATIYHLVTGRNPSDPPYEMYPIRHWNPAFSSGLEKIILKCTQQNPDDRYQSCGELLYALDHYKEEEEGYKKSLNIKWRIFLSSAVMSLIMFVCSAFCMVCKSKTAIDEYNQYISQASATYELEKRYPYYEKAIKLLPEKSDAYIEMIDTMLEDGVFTERESEEIRTVIPNHETELKNNVDSYVKVSYKLGMLYFYYPETGDVDVKNASKWLTIVAGESADGPSEERVTLILGEKQAYRAKSLCKILQYYKELDTVNKEGDSKVDYVQLWNDLSSTVTGNIAAEDNNVTALVMYNFFANQIVRRAEDFKNAGINAADIVSKIEILEKSAEADADNAYEVELYNSLMNNLRHARKGIEIAYGIEG
ncbi:MAG: serine/threonine protein kinase [Lachnospiraceae bacterium]|nr:serine/threonine protein kinase [Lachnospiraceae bacterium]